MPNEIKKLPYALSVAAGQSDNMKRKSISQSSPTALIWTISGIILVACGSDGSRNTSRVLRTDDDPTIKSIEGELKLDDPVPPTDLFGNPTDLVGDYGTLEFVPETGKWTYRAYETDAQAARFREKVTETFTFTDGDDSTETERVVITVTTTLLDDENKETNIGLSYDPNVGIIATSTETGLYTLRIEVSDGEKTETTDFSVVLFPDVTNLTKVLGDGGVNAAIGDDEATSHQFLLGGDNAQRLNAGEDGDVIFGGKGDDIINLGNGGDIVLYRYDGVNTNDSEASDGGDVINGFDRDEDALVLAHESNNVHENADAFYGAIKGISLLVDGDGDVTGIVFTFTDRSNTAQEVDLTVNFDEAFDSTQISNLDTLFDAAASGERGITSGQEPAAYGVINEIFGDNNLVLIDFADIGFELNDAETDIV